MSTVQIYGLYDPETGALRYVGKANDSAERLTRHLTESKTGRRPIHNWIRKLAASGQFPISRVLLECPNDKWEQEERRLIAEHRETSDLLNLADGGAMPSATAEQRRKAAKAGNVKQRSTPAKAAMVKARLEMSRLRTRFLKSGALKQAARLRFLMRIYAVERPQLYGCWASL